MKALAWAFGAYGVFSLILMAYIASENYKAGYKQGRADGRESEREDWRWDSQYSPYLHRSEGNWYIVRRFRGNFKELMDIASKEDKQP